MAKREVRILFSKKALLNPFKNEEKNGFVKKSHGSVFFFQCQKFVSSAHLHSEDFPSKIEKKRKKNLIR